MSEKMVNNLVFGLQSMAEASPVARAIFILWGMRKRTRAEVNLSVLMKTMKNEKFSYTRQEYAEFLEQLASLGIGKLERRKGKVYALRDIGLTLQSIGAVATGHGELKPLPIRIRNKFVKLPIPEKVQTPTILRRRKEDVPEVSLTVTLKGKSLRVDVPNSMNASEIAGVIERLKLL